VLVVLVPVRGRRHPAFLLHPDTFRAERAHVQPDRRRPGPTVEREGERASGTIVVSVELVGSKEDLRLRLVELVYQRDDASPRGVLEAPVLQSQLVLRLNGLDPEELSLLVFALAGFAVLVLFGLRLLFGHVSALLG